MYRKSFIWVFTAAVVIVPLLVFACVKWLENNHTALPVLGEPGHAISDFHLTNDDSQLVSIRSWDNKIVVANFIFTHCPTICPKMTRNLKRIQDAANEDVLINSFTVDPERDTPSKLKAYGKRFGADNKRWQMLTGDKIEIYRLARNSFLVSAADGDGGEEDFIHSEQFVLIDAQKRIRGFYSGTKDADVEKLIKDIRRLQNEK